MNEVEHGIDVRIMVVASDEHEILAFIEPSIR